MQRILIPAIFLFSIFGLGATVYSQCPRMDKSIEKPLRISRGASTVVRDTIRLCTSHTYSFRATRGQRLSIKLTTGNRTSLTLLPPSGEALVDGELAWSGKLNENGRYEIQIGTDATARYTLEVSIK